MKKSVIVLLVVLALVVLVSPGIVGRLAERSVDQGLERAASEAADVSITSQRYDRGWFSSAGRHRLEIRAGTLRNLLVAIVEPEDPEQLPALIIDTRLDHGLIPVGSMGREKGTLLPGLGSAVSTLRFEFPAGETVAIPGAVYSNIGVTGEVESVYDLEPGNHAADGSELRWGQGSIVVASSPIDGRFAVHAELDPVTAGSPGMTLRLGALMIDVVQTPSRFGFPVGSTALGIESLRFDSPSASTTVGPLALDASSGVQGERISASATLSVANTPLGPFGTGSVGAELRLTGADGTALARLQRGLDTVLAVPDPVIAEATLEADVRRLLAAGIELHIDRLAIELPDGTISARSTVTVDESDETAWAALVLALDAMLEVTLPAAVFDGLAALRPEIRTLAALGYLERRADDYRVEVTLSDGRLLINGAPMQLPLDAFR
jgi:uncharacterized protein YdgA (DUF945 family)